MESGLLSGGFSKDRAASLDGGDWRSRSAEFTGERLGRNLALVERLRPVADRHGVSVGAIAVSWTLSWPGVTGAIVGARTPQQIDGWLSAAALEFDEADLDTIATAIEETGAGSSLPSPRQAARTSG